MTLIMARSMCWLTPLLWFLPGIRAFRRTPSHLTTSASAAAALGGTAETTRGIPHRRAAAVHVDIPTDPSGHLVTNLPLLEQGALAAAPHWAGHLPVTGGRQGNGDKYFFYWLFAPPEAEANAPLIIWLNGGPACSSMDGLFLENGPIQWKLDTVTSEYKLVENPHSWHKTPAYTLYIDQPVGTGLSFTTSRTYPKNDEEVNVDFYAFLQNFFSLHEDKFVTGNKVNRDIYFSGESHAGHYIPSMMNYILQRNDAGAGNDGRSIKIPLAGAAIGNGWMDPYHQYSAHGAAYGHGLIDEAQLFKLKEKEISCQKALERGQYTFRGCFNLLEEVVNESYGIKSPYMVSQYDVRRSETKQGSRNFPPGYKITEAYLGGWPLEGHPGQLDVKLKTSVLQAIHATAATAAGQRYEECTDPPYNALSHQDGLGVVEDVVAVLQHASQPRLLSFNGIEDLICNHVGNERFLENLPWKYQDEWMEAKRYAWSAGRASLETPVAGYMKEYRNLLFLKLFNSGHMVPLDVPEVALAMLQVFTDSSQSFKNSEQRLGTALHPPEQDNSTPDCPVCETCEKCTVCPAPATTDHESPVVPQGKSSNSDNFMTILGPVLAVAGLVALAWSCKRSRRLRAGGALKNGAARATDLELRERNTYHDDVELDEKEVL